MLFGIFDYLQNKVWRKAYLLICAWFAFSFSLAIIVSYFTTSPYFSTIYNGISLYLILCLLINIIWWWCRFVGHFNMPILVVSHMFGLAFWYFLMGTAYYYFEYYLDNFKTFEEYKEFMFELLGRDAFQLYYQYFTSVFVFYIIDYTEQFKIKEREKSQLALQNQEMQLSLLKSQINPHFLFNTLNSISVLIGQNKEKARQMITRLSEIFRYAMDSYDDQQVLLTEELKFTENYLKIQKVRFEDRLQFVQNVDKECLNIKVPSMILQPIVENSVKHGISPKEEGGTITITIQRNGSYIHFEVADDGMGINANKGIEEHGSGVGLSVSDQRLRKMYGEESKLKIEADKYGFKVLFKIPL